MAYAILVDEAHRHLGLLESLDAMEEWREGGPKLDTASGMEVDTEARKRERTEREIAQQNDRALQELMQMMPGMRIL